jgi:nicotinamide riboside transporter PnuC
MNELNIFLTGLLFSCVAGVLVGAVFAFAFKRLTRTLAAISAISGLCGLAIVAAWALCIVVRGRGFVGYLCNLLIAPAAYIGVFTGWNIYSYALGILIQIGLMALAGWLMWHWITTREKKKCEPAGGAYVSPAAGDPSAHP